MSVLIVEDNADLRHLFRMALTVAGFHVREAHDGYHALAAIDEASPDVVVLDLGLPHVSGFTVLEEILARPHVKAPAVVIVTGRDGVDRRDVTVLRKPVEPTTLVGAVRGAIRRSARISPA